jgi:hypothetical protein
MNNACIVCGTERAGNLNRNLNSIFYDHSGQPAQFRRSVWPSM